MYFLFFFICVCVLLFDFLTIKINVFKRTGGRVERHKWFNNLYKIPYFHALFHRYNIFLQTGLYFSFWTGPSF